MVRGVTSVRLCKRDLLARPFLRPPGSIAVLGPVKIWRKPFNKHISIVIFAHILIKKTYRQK